MNLKEFLEAEGLKEKVKKNHKEQHGVELTDEELLDFDSVSDLFFWDETIEGHDYWSDVYLKHKSPKESIEAEVDLFDHEAEVDLFDHEVGVKPFGICVVGGGKMPIKSTAGAFCYDLFAREIEKVDDHYYIVKLGIKTKIPNGACAKLYPRSGITNTGWGMANSVGVIDSDFLGEWQARFRPFMSAETKKFPFSVGDRVAQFNFEFGVNDCLVGEIPEDEYDFKTDRGDGGFNSTGK